MHYHFNDEISTESINDLMEKLEGREGINLWFSTNGGLTTAMKCLVEFFNSLGDNIEITLTDRVCSAGVDLLLDYTGKLRCKELDFILIHKGSRHIDSVRGEKELIKQDRTDNKNYSKKLKKLGLNKKQLKRYKQGKDVILYEKHFKQINLK